MIVRYYSVYDKAVEAYLRPFEARSDGEAVRMFKASCKGNPEFAANARDYDLYFISSFDDLVGEFGVPVEERLTVPRFITTGKQLLASAAAENVSQAIESVTEAE